MRNSMQILQGEVGHIGPAGPISLPGPESQREQEEKLELKNVTRATSDIIIEEGGKEPHGEANVIKNDVYSVYSHEDNDLGIAWCDVVFK